MIEAIARQGDFGNVLRKRSAIHPTSTTRKNQLHCRDAHRHNDVYLTAEHVVLSKRTYRTKVLREHHRRGFFVKEFKRTFVNSAQRSSVNNLTCQGICKETMETTSNTEPSSFHKPSPSFDIVALEDILKTLPCQRPLAPLPLELSVASATPMLSQ